MLFKTTTLAKAGRTLYREERLQVEGSILLLKTTKLGRQTRHFMRDKRLQVEGSILLLKKQPLYQGKQGIA